MRQLAEVRRRGRGKHVRYSGLDARVLLIAITLFIGCVVTVGKYDLARVSVFLPFPLMLAPVLGVSLRLLFRKLIFVSPFLLCVGIFNPIFDTSPMLDLGPFHLSAGWVSFLVITLKAVISVSASTLLFEALPFEEIAAGLRSLKVPNAFVVQLLFLHRYLFVLAEEAQSMRMARDLKSFGGRGTGISATVGLLGTLFLRTLDRSQRIHQCMLSRGFDGTVRVPARRSLGARDAVLLVLMAALFAALRLGGL